MNHQRIGECFRLGIMMSGVIWLSLLMTAMFAGIINKTCAASGCQDSYSYYGSEDDNQGFCLRNSTAFGCNVRHQCCCGDYTNQTCVSRDSLKPEQEQLPLRFGWAATGMIIFFICLSMAASYHEDVFIHRSGVSGPLLEEESQATVEILEVPDDSRAVMPKRALGMNME